MPRRSKPRDSGQNPKNFQKRWRFMQGMPFNPRSPVRVSSSFFLCVPEGASTSERIRSAFLSAGYAEAPAKGVFAYGKEQIHKSYAKQVLAEARYPRIHVLVEGVVGIDLNTVQVAISVHKDNAQHRTSRNPAVRTELDETAHKLVRHMEKGGAYAASGIGV